MHERRTRAAGSAPTDPQQRHELRPADDARAVLRRELARRGGDLADRDVDALARLACLAGGVQRPALVISKSTGPDSTRFTSWPSRRKAASIASANSGHDIAETACTVLSTRFADGSCICFHKAMPAITTNGRPAPAPATL